MKTIKKGVNDFEMIITDKGLNIEDNSGKMIMFMTHDEATILFFTLGMKYSYKESEKFYLDEAIEEANKKHAKLKDKIKDLENELEKCHEHIEFIEKRNDDKNGIIDAFNTLIQGKL